MEKHRGTKKGSKIIGTNPHHFGRTLAAARRKKGLTQVELAMRLETTSRTISYYERESKNPSLEMVKKIADALAVRPENLLNLPGNDNENGTSGDDTIDRNLSKKFEVAQKLPLEARAQLKKFIDTLAKANNIQE
jgi:transcriptional regulator with XRE-family HTH domain